MNKKLLTLLLALTMWLTLAACGAEKPSGGDAQHPGTEDAAPEDGVDGVTGELITEVEPVEPEALEPAEPENLPANPNETPSGGTLPADPDEVPQSQPVQKPEENIPAQTPEPTPEAPSADSVDLAAFYETALTKGEWPAMGPLEGEALEAFYPGLSGISASQCLVSMAQMGSVVAEIALVEVHSAADVEAVKAIFQGRVDYQVGDENNPGGAWYPESIEGWKNHSRIVSIGNCVMLVAHSAADEVTAAFSALFA